MWPDLAIFERSWFEIFLESCKNSENHFEKHNFLGKNCEATIWATFGEIGLLFVLPFGHIAVIYENNKRLNQVSSLSKSIQCFVCLEQIVCRVCLSRFAAICLWKLPRPQLSFWRVFSVADLINILQLQFTTLKSIL